MKNYVLSGDRITVPAPADLASGQAVLIGDLFGVASTSAKLGEPVTLRTHGVFLLAKKPEDVIAIGARLHFDAVAGRLVLAADGPYVAIAWAEAPADSEAVEARITGTALSALMPPVAPPAPPSLT